MIAGLLRSIFGVEVGRMKSKVPFFSWKLKKAKEIKNGVIIINRLRSIIPIYVNSYYVNMRNRQE